MHGDHSIACAAGGVRSGAADQDGQRQDQRENGRASHLADCVKGAQPGLTDEARHQVKMRVVIDAHVLQKVVGVACAKMDRHHGSLSAAVEGRGDARVNEAKFSGVCVFHIVSRQFTGRTGIMHHLKCGADLPGGGAVDTCVRPGDPIVWVLTQQGSSR